MRFKSCLMIVGGILASTLLAASERPNIVLVLSDDQGWGDFQGHGNKQIDTPAMARLAAEGARFEKFYVSPVCAPTRASLLTGRYHRRGGVHGVTRGRETMRAEEVTLAEVFKQAGYATGCFGKWHNGANYPFHPRGQGFDEFFGFCAGHWNNYFDADLEHNGRPVRSKGFITNVITDRAIAFIQGHRQGPFFCYVPFNTPHSPWQVPDRYFDKYKARGLDDKTACAYAMCDNLDENLGRLLGTLDDLDLERNTIVVFLSDNGPNSDRYNGGMKGRKGSVHQGGIRVPCFIRFPGRIPAGRKIDHFEAAHIDLLPTLVELAGIPRPRTLPLDGRSMAAALVGDRGVWPDRLLFTNWRNRGAVRDGRYVSTRGELYDLLADPNQKKNLVTQQPAIQEKLQLAYAQWHKDVSRRGFDPIPTEVGHAQWPVVRLRGHEALLQPPDRRPRDDRRGLGIRFNGRPGWANDWVTGWTSLSAFPSWPVRVVRGGRYRVTLRYCCEPADLGARVAVVVGTSRVVGQVMTAFPAKRLPRPNRIVLTHGAQDDMFWASLQLGTLSLEPGDHSLEVRALSRPGKTVIQLKAVWLERLESSGN